MKRFSLGWLLFCLVSVSHAAPSLLPEPFELQFKTRIYGMNVTAEQVLSINQDRYLLQQTTKAPLISIQESSSFQFNAEQHVVPLRYDYQRSVFGKKLNRKNTFAVANSEASYQENKKALVNIQVTADITDQLNFIIPIQQWLKQSDNNAESKLLVPQLKRKRISNDTYQLLRSEWLQTDLGWFDTVVIEKIHSDPERKTLIWLAKDWQFLVVKMQHEDDDLGHQEIFIQQGKLAGKTIKGLSSIPSL